MYYNTLNFKYTIATIAILGEKVFFFALCFSTVKHLKNTYLGIAYSLSNPVNSTCFYTMQMNKKCFEFFYLSKNVLQECLQLSYNEY